MPDDILTTAEAAKLLGVSVRTVQLWVEGGTLTSWKTPGGHRRLLRSTVEAEICKQTVPRPSALIQVIAARPALDTYLSAVASVSECLVDGYDDVFTGLRAVGARAPFALVVGADSFDMQERALLKSLLHDVNLSRTTIISISRKLPKKSDPDIDSSGRVHRMSSANAVSELPAFLRALFTKVALRDAGASVPAYSFPVAVNEAERLLAVERTELVGSPCDETFDRLTRMAAGITSTPFSLVTLLTRDEQWFKSKAGLPLTATPRDWAFCNYTILQRGVFSVFDLSKDDRFSTIPGVMKEPRLRFYAGAPIFDAWGYALGSVCVMDTRPRRLSELQNSVLLDLAAIATDAICNLAAMRDNEKN